MSENRIGAVDDPKMDMGSLISRAHREKVAGIVERARDADARIVCGGRIPPESPEGGAYYEPTPNADAAQDSEIVQDEVFGPVLVTLPFDTDDEALELANDTPYGLASSAWTTNVFRAQRATREIQAGCMGSTITSRSSARCPTAATKPPDPARTCRRTHSTSTPTSNMSCPTSPATPTKAGTTPFSAGNRAPVARSP
jgi:acyl-CoA reductase-like NAD-dependent aldehyde dehydrogenase